MQADELEAVRETNLQDFSVDLEPVAFKSDTGPRFIVTVDTEEEFDWDSPFTRDQHGTSHAQYLDRFQMFCDGFGVHPIYLVDYPIVQDDLAAELLADICRNGRGSVGVQLHPWVNPPFEEKITDHNSYACNLPADLERAKLTTLYDAIVRRIGVRPRIYRAGRYGAGANTAAILQELGICIDSSVRSLFDYSEQGGPDYFNAPLVPHWVEKNVLAELPLTTVMTGQLKRWGRGLFPYRNPQSMTRSLFARLGLLERIALTPEGIPVGKALQAIDAAVDMYLPLLNFSFHSPSLRPGHTPYVRTDEDLDAFYDWWRAVFAHLQLRGVRPVSLDNLLAEIFAC